jgi:hypothetical protein
MKTIISLILLILSNNASAQIKEVQSNVISRGEFGNISYSVTNEIINQKISNTTLSLFIYPSEGEISLAKQFGNKAPETIYFIFKKETSKYFEFIEILNRLVLNKESKSNYSLELESSDNNGSSYKISNYVNDVVYITKYPFAKELYMESERRVVQYKLLKQLYDKLKEL